MALDPDSIVQQGIGLSLLTLKSFTPVIIFSDSDFKSSHNKNDYTCVMDSTLTITRPRELPSRITSHFVIQFWKVFNVHVNDNLYVFRTCLITINTLAYLIYLRRFFFNFKWKYIRKFDFVFVIIIYYCMVITISILKRILRTLCCFLFFIIILHVHCDF